MCRYRGKGSSTSFFLRFSCERTWPHGNVYRVWEGSSSSIFHWPSGKIRRRVPRRYRGKMLEGSKLNLLAELYLLDSLLDQASGLLSHRANCHRSSFFLFFSLSVFFFLFFFLPLFKLNCVRNVEDSLKSLWKEESSEWSLYSCFFLFLFGFQKFRSYRAVYKCACARKSPAHAFRARVPRARLTAHAFRPPISRACLTRIFLTAHAFHLMDNAFTFVSKSEN